MRSVVDVGEVEKLIAAGAQLVEVLPRSEYEEQHLPGAVSIPLKELRARSGELDADRPVVVYCYDTQCDMSPRAAAQLDHLGFGEVYDFVAGKMAWLGMGLPSEGRQSDADRAGTIASDVPICGPDDTVADNAAKLTEHGLCAVVDPFGVVLGTVGRDALEQEPEAVVAEVMHAGPLTVRPDTPRSELTQLLDRISPDHVLVTTLAGELLGWVRRGDLGEPAAAADPEREATLQGTEKARATAEEQIRDARHKGDEWVEEAQR
jgi:rhodanese-related sulfurtransferase